MNLTKKYQARRGNKYGAKAVVVNGERFDSQGEREMHALLLLMERGKLISNIRRQQSVYLTDASIQYIVDFLIFDEKTKEEVWIEFKGIELSQWRIKKKLWKFYGPGPLRIYKKAGNRIFQTEEVVPVTQEGYLQKKLTGRP